MAFVQGDKASSGTNVSTLSTPGITTTSGNWMAAVVSADNGPKTVTSFTDSKGNTWTAATANPQAANGQFNIYVFYKENIVGGSAHTVTANFSGATGCAISVVELSGRLTSASVIAQQALNEASATTNHTSAATGVLAASGCDIVCLAGDNAQTQVGANETYTPGSGYTMPATANVSTGATTPTSYVIYQENVTTATQTATWTNSNGSLKAASVILAVAPAAGGASTLTASTGTFSLTGEAVTLTQTGASSQTLIAAPGAFSFNGGSSISSLQLPATTGTFAFVGQSAILNWPQGGLSDPGNLVWKNVFVITPSGSQKAWVDYIPVVFVNVTAAKANRYDFDGALAVKALSSVTGLVPWVDYLPVATISGTAVWRTDDSTGYIPMVKLV